MLNVAVVGHALGLLFPRLFFFCYINFKLNRLLELFLFYCCCSFGSWTNSAVACQFIVVVGLLFPFRICFDIKCPAKGQTICLEI